MLNPPPPESTRKNRNKRKRLVRTTISAQPSEKPPYERDMQHFAHTGCEFCPERLILLPLI
jgi:hypothetical protein